MAKTITYLSEVPVSGPLAPLVGEFKASLADAGYVVPVAREHLWLMAQVSRWMEDRGLSVGDLDDVRVEAFLADRRAAGRRTLCSARGLAPLLRLLRAHGLPGAAPPAGAVEELLAGFGRYLADERAVAPSTARLYTKRVRRFLARCAPDANLRAVSAGQVTAAVLAECETVSVGSAQYFVAALRSFLRFCYLERLTDTDLSAAALAVSGRRPSWLPKGMSRRAEGRSPPCWAPVTGGRRLGGATTPSCCSWPAWVFGRARSPPCGWRTSTGALESCWFGARGRASIVFRCRSMSARLSPPTSRGEGHEPLAGRCSSVWPPRSAPWATWRSPTWSAAPVVVPASSR